MKLTRQRLDDAAAVAGKIKSRLWLTRWAGEREAKEVKNRALEDVDLQRDSHAPKWKRLGYNEFRRGLAGRGVFGCKWLYYSETVGEKKFFAENHEGTGASMGEIYATPPRSGVCSPNCRMASFRDGEEALPRVP